VQGKERARLKEINQKGVQNIRTFSKKDMIDDPKIGLGAFVEVDSVG
jgi:hypothetical protein